MNVFEVESTDSSSSSQQSVSRKDDKVSIREIILKSRAKRSGGGGSSTEPGVDPGHEFHSDTTYIYCCEIIAVVVTVVITGFYAIYYFCNKDLVENILANVKHIITKLFRK